MPQDFPVTDSARDQSPANRPGAWRSIGRIALGILRFPGNLVTAQLSAKTGESRFGLEEDRMIMRTLIDMLFWSVILVCGVWVVLS